MSATVKHTGKTLRPCRTDRLEAIAGHVDIVGKGEIFAEVCTCILVIIVGPHILCVVVDLIGQQDKMVERLDKIGIFFSTISLKLTNGKRRIAERRECSQLGIGQFARI